MPSRDSVTSVPAFRGLWLATAEGDAARQVALFATSVILTVTLGASAFEVGLASPLSNAGALLFGLVAGTFVDRWGSKRSLMGSVWVRFAAYAVPVSGWWLGWLAAWQLLACVLVASIADTFYSAAHSSVLPRVVGRPRVAHASARLQATDQVIWLLGPSAAGAAVKWVAAPWLLIVSAVAQVLAVLGLRRIQDDQPVAVGERERFRDSVRAGLRFLVGSRWIGAIALAASLNNAAAGFLGSAEAVFLLRELGFSTLAYGLVMAASGIGGVLGAVLAPSLGRIWSPFRTLVTGACLMPVSFALLPFSYVMQKNLGHGWAETCAGVSMFGFGMCIGLFGVSSAGLTARLTPKRLLARVSSTRRTFTQGAVVVGGLFGALCSQLFGAMVPLIIAVAVSATQLIPLVRAARPGASNGANDAAHR